MYSSEDIRDFFKGYKSEAVVKEHRFYSVLIPLVEREGKMHVLLEKRAAHISQPGEICFPGGRIEAGEQPQAARCVSAMKKSAFLSAKSSCWHKEIPSMDRPISPFIPS